MYSVSMSEAELGNGETEESQQRLVIMYALR